MRIQAGLVGASPAVLVRQVQQFTVQGNGYTLVASMQGPRARARACGDRSSRLIAARKLAVAGTSPSPPTARSRQAPVAPGRADSA